MAPAGRDLDQGIEDEVAPGERAVRHGQPAAMPPNYSLPRRDNVEIKHSRPPAAPTAPPEVALDRVEQGENARQCHAGIDRDNRIGERALAGAERRRRADRRASYRFEPSGRQRRYGGGNDIMGRSILAMKTVAAQGDVDDCRHGRWRLTR